MSKHLKSLNPSSKAGRGKLLGNFCSRDQCYLHSWRRSWPKSSHSLSSVPGMRCSLLMSCWATPLGCSIEVTSFLRRASRSKKKGWRWRNSSLMLLDHSSKSPPSSSSLQSVKLIFGRRISTLLPKSPRLRSNMGTLKRSKRPSLNLKAGASCIFGSHPSSARVAHGSWKNWIYSLTV